MLENSNKFEDYFAHLTQISLLGRIYKRFISSPVLFFCARRFGAHVVEIGSGTGSGVLGTFPKYVHGLEINPIAVEYCKSLGLNVQLINDEVYPAADGVYDSCILDNVLEHIENPRAALDECHRIIRQGGGLVIAVPGVRGFESDSDHKIFYGEDTLRILDERWILKHLFSSPFFIISDKLSKSVRQYCLVAVYEKK